MSKCSFLKFVLGIVAPCQSAAAQMQWVPLGPLPPSHAVWPMAFDVARDRLVCLRSSPGGYGVSEYNGQAWANSSALPLALFGIYGMCYDEGRGETLLCGGLSDVWTWSGTKWSLASTQFPSPAFVSALAYHRGRQSVMALATMVSGGQHELWEWNGSGWAVVAGGQPLPTGQLFEALAYDSSRDRLVSCCGFTQNASGVTVLPHTWEWEAGSGWKIVNSSSPLRTVAGLAFDEAREVMVLTVNTGSLQPYECWERVGSGAWVQRGLTPGRFHGLHYDPIRRRMLAFENTGYSYQPIYPAGLTTFAPGCPGPLGIPTIALTAPHTGAWIGGTLQVRVDHAPNPVAGLLLGFSNTSYQGLALPIDLGPIGMSGCSLRVAPENFLLCSGTAAFADCSIPVPNANGLRGVNFYLQAAVPAPTTNPARLVTSDAVVGTIGSR